MKIFELQWKYTRKINDSGQIYTAIIIAADEEDAYKTWRGDNWAYKYGSVVINISEINLDNSRVLVYNYPISSLPKNWKVIKWNTKK